MMGLKHKFGFELKHGRPFLRPWGMMAPEVPGNTKVIYKIMNHMTTSLSLQAPAQTEECPELITKAHLLLKVFKRKWQEPRWVGPFKITERTNTAVRLEGKGSPWFHLSQCAKAPSVRQQEKNKGTVTSDTPNA